MKKHVSMSTIMKMLAFVGFIFYVGQSLATTCPNAINIPSIPVTNQALVCGPSNDLSATTVPAVCGGAGNAYKGGNEALYTYTPAATGVHNISISGVTWTSIFVYQGCPTSGGICVGSVGSSASSKTFSPTLTAGLEYFIWFDTWPAPNSPCPGTFSINGPPPPPPCAGTPNAGTAAISATSGCVGIPVTLSATGISTGPGISYQWQSSPTGAAPWTDIPGATSSSSIITTTIGTSFYRLRTLCSNSGLDNFTTNAISYNGNITDFCECGTFCAATATNTSDEWLSNVTFAGINNNSGSTTYSNFTSLSSGNVIPGQSYPFSSTVSQTGTFAEFVTIWIDWNQNGVFDGGELTNIGTCNSNGCILSNNVSVPVDAVIGTTRMRVILRYNLYQTNPCETFTFGEVEDYCITVSPAANCAGIPDPGTATISSTSGCISTNFNLGATGISFGTGISYQWQSSPTGAAPWTDIPGATTVAYTTSALLTTSYRLRTFCSISGEENFSTVVTYNAVECYIVPFSGNNTITTCSGILYDHGGPTGDYANNANGYTVINAAIPGNLVQLNGTINTEASWDFVTIFDGVGTGGAVLFNGSGSQTISDITSSTGSLTVRFTSDGSVIAPGFALNISCQAPCFPSAEPGFGNNVWNVLGYNVRDITLATTVYRGYYVESDLSYNTQLAWDDMSSPAAAAGYDGCSINNENHTVVSKRQGVPANGVYQLDIANHDDEYIMFVNGLKAFENNYANMSHIGVAVGYFDGSTNFEMRHGELGGASKHALTFTLQNLNANVASVNPTTCAPSNGQITFSNPTGAVASPVFRSTFEDNAGLSLAGSANVSNGVLNLTPAINSSYGTAILTNQTNTNASVFRAEFDFRVWDGGGADGFSFNYAPSYPASPVYDGYEQGFGSGLSVCFITFNGAGGPFVRVVYNGVAISGNVSVPIRNVNYRQSVVSVNENNQISVSIGGFPVITNLQLPPAFATTDKTNWQFAFASRTGGVNDTHRIDNVVINAFNQYEYSVNGSTWSSNPVFTGLNGGSYTPQIRNKAFPLYPASLPAVTLTNPTTSGVDVVSASAPYTWIDGNTYTTDNNSATFTLTGSNGCDSIVTLNLTIIMEDGPANDLPCDAFDLTSSGQQDLNTYAFLADMTCNNQIGNNSTANAENVGAACDGELGRSLWYSFTTPMCGVSGAVPFEIELSTNNAGTNFNTKLYLFASPSNNCSSLTQLACNDDFNGSGYPALCGTAGASASTIVSTTLLPNTQYWVRVDGLNFADVGNFVLSGRAIAPAHGVAPAGGGTQIQLTTANMGAALYTYYYKQVGSTGYSTANSQTALTDTRTLASGNDYITQIMYRCDANFFNQAQWYRTAPQTISLASTCAVVNDMTCTFNGPNSYTLTWTQPSGILYTDGGLSGYRIKRNPIGSTGVFTYSNPAVVCSGGTCSVTLPGNSPTGFNWTIETRCSANNIQVGNTTSCGPAPAMTLGNDGNNNVDRSAVKVFSFVNAEAGIEFVDVQMFDAYADFGLNTPMIGDYEIFVNDNNEINWRRVDAPANMSFDFIIVPNPANAMTTVFLNTIVEEGTFTVVDAMGRTINSGSINNTDNINIDAAQLQSGVYLVVVTVGNQKMTKRLVVAN